MLDPTRPEILLYERKPNGKFRLTGVEYYLEADRATGTPSLFGQTFQGPMPAHHPGMETHYDLHARTSARPRRANAASLTPT